MSVPMSVAPECRNVISRGPVKDPQAGIKAPSKGAKWQLWSAKKRRRRFLRRQFSVCVSRRSVTYRKAPRVGLEPTTIPLTAGCSTIELSRNPKVFPWGQRTSLGWTTLDLPIRLSSMESWILYKRIDQQHPPKHCLTNDLVVAVDRFPTGQTRIALTRAWP